MSRYNHSPKIDRVTKLIPSKPKHSTNYKAKRKEKTDIAAQPVTTVPLPRIITIVENEKFTVCLSS